MNPQQYNNNSRGRDDEGEREEEFDEWEANNDNSDNNDNDDDNEENDNEENDNEENDENNEDDEEDWVDEEDQDQDYDPYFDGQENLYNELESNTDNNDDDEEEEADDDDEEDEGQEELIQGYSLLEILARNLGLRHTLTNSFLSNRDETVLAPNPRAEKLKEEFVYSVKVNTGLGVDDTTPWYKSSTTGSQEQESSFSCGTLSSWEVENTNIKNSNANEIDTDNDTNNNNDKENENDNDNDNEIKDENENENDKNNDSQKAQTPFNVALRLRQREMLVSPSAKMIGTSRMALSNRYLPTPSYKLENFHGRVFCGQYSSDGKVFVAASQDEHIRMFDVQDKHRLTKDIEARDVGWSIIDVAYSPDQTYVIYSSWSRCIHLINVSGTHNIHEDLDLQPSYHRFCPFSIKFSADSREILAGCNDSSIYIYDIGAGKRSLTFTGHGSDVNTVAFADETSNIIFSGSDDYTCKVWDRRILTSRNPKPVGTLNGHRRGITYIDSKNDGKCFLSNGKDSKIKIWDIRVMYDEHGNKRAAAKNVDNSLMSLSGHVVADTLIRATFSPAFSTGQRYVVSGSANGRVYLYDTYTGELVSNILNHRGTVRDVSWHPYESMLASSSWDGTVGIWKIG